MSRTDRFIARVDECLKTLPDDAARRRFLEVQLETWEHRYSEFIAAEGDSLPVTNPADRPTAFDYVCTIAALAGRRDLIKHAAVLEPAE
jgi:hypothetical protein